MSVKLMSLVFRASICDLDYHDGSKAKRLKGSTAKLILLAYADHANDDGVAAYPSISLLERKTSLRRQSIVNGIKALVENGLLQPRGVSERGTNEYAISITKLNALVNSVDCHKKQVVNPVDQQVVNPVDQGSQPGGLKPSINHPINHPEYAGANAPAAADAARAPEGGQSPPLQNGKTSKPKSARKSKKTRARKDKKQTLPAEVLRPAVVAWAVLTGLIPDDQAEVPSTVYPRVAREARRALLAKRKAMGGEAVAWPDVLEALKADLRAVYRGWWAWDGRETAPGHAQVHELLARVWAGTWPPKGNGKKRRGKLETPSPAVDEVW